MGVDKLGSPNTSPRSIARELESARADLEFALGKKGKRDQGISRFNLDDVAASW